jgi:TatD DNase family protein
MPFINIHTHTASGDRNVRELLSANDHFDQIQPDNSYSLGLHPWHIRKENVQTEFEKLVDTCMRDNVFAIGECGLDKVCAVGFDLQRNCFQQQIQLANAVNKPMIIHCVRAHEEVMQELKMQKVSVPVVFHGFNKNKVFAEKILREGYYLSFGKHLLQEEGRLVFKDIPLNKVFLETDTAALSIQSVYEAAASVNAIGLKALMQQIVDNAASVFGKRFLENE